MNRTLLKALLVKHEGLKLKPYLDTATPPNITIGVGRNLTDDGISESEAKLLLDDDIDRALLDLRRLVMVFGTLSDARQHVLVSMIFNLGTRGFLKFQRFLAAVNALEFERAASEMLASVWAKEVGERAGELAQMMRAG